MRAGRRKGSLDCGPSWCVLCLEVVEGHLDLLLGDGIPLVNRVLRQSRGRKAGETGKGADVD